MAQRHSRPARAAAVRGLPRHGPHHRHTPTADVTGAPVDSTPDANPESRREPSLEPVTPQPSEAAAQRLAESLQRRTSAYRTDATVDLTMIDALLRHEGAEAAREALDDHTSSLDALLADLRAAVAEAAFERDAGARRAAVSPPRPRPVDRRGALLRRVRAQLVRVGSAAAVVLTLLVSTPRTAGPDALLATNDRAAHAPTGAARSRAAGAKKTASQATASRLRSVRQRWLRSDQASLPSRRVMVASSASVTQGRPRRD